MHTSLTDLLKQVELGTLSVSPQAVQEWRAAVHEEYWDVVKAHLPLHLKSGTTLQAPCTFGSLAHLRDTYVTAPLTMKSCVTLARCEINAPTEIGHSCDLVDVHIWHIPNRKRHVHHIGNGIKLARATLKGAALIERQVDALVVGCSPVTHRMVTLHRDAIIGWRVNCGCFTGTLDQFERKIARTHGKDPRGYSYRWYRALLKQFREHAKRWDK